MEWNLVEIHPSFTGTGNGFSGLRWVSPPRITIVSPRSHAIVDSCRGVRNCVREEAGRSSSAISIVRARGWDASICHCPGPAFLARTTTVSYHPSGGLGMLVRSSAHFSNRVRSPEPHDTGNQCNPVVSEASHVWLLPDAPCEKIRIMASGSLACSSRGAIEELIIGISLIRISILFFYVVNVYISLGQRNKKKIPSLDIPSAGSELCILS